MFKDADPERLSAVLQRSPYKDAFGYTNWDIVASVPIATR